MNYPNSVEFLYSLGNEVKTLKLGLERIEAVLRSLNQPQNAFRSVHIAGTNGKGSTCAMIEAGLRAAGVPTGLYTSPHLVEPTERIQIGGEPVSRGDFARAFGMVHEVSQDMLAAGTLDFHPTYFETVTAMAFLLFRERGVETAVVETGLGGRLDATNVLAPELAVITAIDYDHQMYLGNTIEQIAREKAGILKPGVPAVIARQQHADADRMLLEAAPSALRTAEVEVSGVVLSATGSCFRYRGRLVECPLAGEHQVENAVTACAALDLLGAPVEGIRATRWPARLELIGSVLLDGAHNPAGARMLRRHLERFYRGRSITLIFGAMRDKAAAEMLEILKPLAGRLVFTAADTPRAMPPGELRAMAGGGLTAATVREALEARSPEDLTVVAGSLFLTGEARAVLIQ